jgi:RNA polymerase sigma-70 factor, ECF subfamily
MRCTRPGRTYHLESSTPSLVRPDEKQPDAPAGPELGSAGLHLQSSVDLIARLKGGDAAAADVLCARYLPILRRWARGRLPAYARDLLTTDDLVQETIYRVLQHLDAFEYRHEGSLQAYLRQALLNQIRDEVRRAVRRPAPMELEDRHADPAASPLEEAIGHDELERYETALQRLSPRHREAIIARVELQCTYEQVGAALGISNANAARSVVVRALYRLYEEMKDGE